MTVFDGGPPVGLSAPRTDHAEPCTWSARPFDVTAKRKGEQSGSCDTHLPVEQDGTRAADEAADPADDEDENGGSAATGAVVTT